MNNETRSKLAWGEQRKQTIDRMGRAVPVEGWCGGGERVRVCRRERNVGTSQRSRHRKSSNARQCLVPNQAARSATSWTPALNQQAVIRLAYHAIPSKEFGTQRVKRSPKTWKFYTIFKGQGLERQNSIAKRQGDESEGMVAAQRRAADRNKNIPGRLTRSANFTAPTCLLQTWPVESAAYKWRSGAA
ncbi:hypothetical protein J6590_047356 [Homalodisca vitripennis]|nr:hypothetical protein J6590_047356 [Homalodisca vitripennis]